MARFTKLLAGSMLLLGTAAFVQAGQLPGQGQPPQAQPAPQPETAVAATVNGDKVTQAEVQANLQRHLQGREVPPEAADQLRSQVLEHLIESRLVEQYALDQAEVEQQEVEAVLQQFKQQLEQQGLEFEMYLATQGQTEESLEKRMEGSLAWQKYQQEQVTEPKLQEFFEENRAAFEGAEFDDVRQEVTQAYVGELWSSAVEEMRPKTEIDIAEPEKPETPPIPQQRIPQQP